MNQHNSFVVMPESSGLGSGADWMAGRVTAKRCAALLLVLAFSLTGCSETSSGSSTQSPTGANEPSSDATAGEVPESDGGATDSSEQDASAGDAPDEPVMTLVVGETTRGFADGVGSEARFQGITCMTIAPDGSALYVSDTFNGIVRRVDTETGEVKTIGGKALSLSTSDGTGDLVRFTEPRGLGITPDGALLWIADGPTLRTLDVNTGEAITWAGLPGEAGFVDGDSVEARLGFLIHDVEISEDGSAVLLSDRSNDRIRVWDVEGETLTSLAGGGPKGADGVGSQVGFDGNGGVVRNGTQLYIADTFSHTLRRLDLESGEVMTVAGQAGQAGSTNGDLTTARFDSPQGVTHKDGALYAGGFDGQLRKVDLSTSAVSTLPTTGLTGTFSPPVAAPNKNSLYYADLSTEAVLRIDLDTNGVTNLAGPVQPQGNVDGPLEGARFGWIYGLEASADGERIYIADPGNMAVRVVDLTTEEVTSITHTTWDAPVGLALDEAGGRLFVSDANSGALWTVTLANGAVTPLGSGGLDMPWGMAFTGETLYVAEHAGLRIQAVDVGTGDATVVAGSGLSGHADGPAADARFQGPLSLAWSDTAETLYVTDFTGHTVRAFHPADGTVSTVAGDTTAGSADGVPGGLSEPSGVLVRDGQLLIADTGNHTVRLWDPETGLSTLVGSPGVAASIGPGSGVPISEATLTLPEAVAAGETGLFVSVEYSVMHIPWEVFGSQESP